MRLTKFSDYALRVLILAASHPGRTLTIDETARLFAVSAPHLKKVVRSLAQAGYLEAFRGRSGGYRLARAPERITLGEVLRATEPDFALTECYRPGNACGLTCCCTLPPILDEALGAMLGVLDRHTLADIAVAPGVIAALPAGPGATAPQRG